MATSVTLNGVSYSIPAPGDTSYASGLSDFLIAIPATVLQKSGGTFTLTAEADFGGSFGFKAFYVKSSTALPSTTGIIRLAKTDKVSWRNNANTADLAFGINASNGLQFDGSDISGTGTVTSVAVTDPAAGIVVTGDPITTAGTLVIALANDLAALEGLGSTGIAVRTASDTWAQRSVAGTANRITVTQGDGVAGNPTVDLSTSYVGQATITTLGTITTGVWNGSAVPIANGGTGQATATLAFNALDPLTTKGDVIAHDGTNSVRMAVGTNDQFMLADSAATPGVKWGVPATGYRLRSITSFTSTGTWTKPSGVVAVFAQVQAGGGGSSGADATVSEVTFGGGGGGGGYSQKFIESGLGATETVTVGAGGTAGASTSGTGGNGGASSFGAHATTSGGAGGDASASGTTVAAGYGAGRVGGTGASGDLNVTGSGCGLGIRVSATSGRGGNGGSSFLGGAQTSAESTNNIGLVGIAPGGGASGAVSNGPANAGAAGGDGVVIVWEYIR